jgi:hypothetical protein
VRLRCRRIHVTKPFQVLFLVLLLIEVLGISSAFSGNRRCAGVGSEPVGKGSLSSRLFANGTVCLVNERNPAICRKELVRIPQRIMKTRDATFYGVFDLDGDGNPEVFLGYWPPLADQDDDNTVLTVYKKIGRTYRRYLRLKAQSIGYAPGAWFLSEPPHPKAVFMTRYGGSSGTGLYYLNLKKKRLELISGSVFLEDYPEFVDIDGDSMAEIFLPGRGRDRTSQPGCAVLHWNGSGYEIWWPNWSGLPRVIYAALADIDGDGKKEIAAVLEPETEAADSDKYVDGETRMPRELGIWKVGANNLTRISKAELPDSRHLSEPTFGRVPPFSPSIELNYTRTFGCTLEGNEIMCHEKE